MQNKAEYCTIPQRLNCGHLEIGGRHYKFMGSNPSNPCIDVHEIVVLYTMMFGLYRIIVVITCTFEQDLA